MACAPPSACGISPQRGEKIWGGCSPSGERTLGWAATAGRGKALRGGLPYAPALDAAVGVRGTCGYGFADAGAGAG